MKTLVITILVAFCGPLMYAQEAEAMLEKSRNLTRVESFESTTKLTITDKNGNKRERTNMVMSKNFSDGTEKRLILFTDPPEVSGTSILLFDHPAAADEMWIYLPALKKTRRVISAERGKSFMGSEFSNADISWPANSEFNSRFITGEKDGTYMYIESIPIDDKTAKEYGYSRRISSIDRSTMLIRTIRFFDSEGNNFKTIEIPEYKKAGTGGKFMIARMEAVNHLNGRSSLMVMTDIVVPAGKDDSIFDPLRLGR